MRLSTRPIASSVPHITHPNRMGNASVFRHRKQASEGINPPSRFHGIEVELPVRVFRAP